MAIIIGMYDELSTAQHVVHDLQISGFEGRNLHLATCDDRKPREEPAGLLGRLSSVFSKGSEDLDLVHRLTAWGVPKDEAQHYAGALHQGSTLVLVDAPSARSQEAMDILDGYRPLEGSRASRA